MGNLKVVLFTKSLKSFDYQRKTSKKLTKIFKVNLPSAIRLYSQSDIEHILSFSVRS